ncbi:protein PLASTID MOVEMENT IMPAIRED 1-RELATED 1-like [Telopea speciosissima]|uniref:protein PLASTID MOVEMENT IMPAIRED 1-RELATED 1-like n=1 Tax=Telopea speciosissima TaxID=54955 RepID=UPI001CC7BC42|nr:protein PLASTID MOVEMENT IMPAIRED 1-RELATED 1-like [Telopea speciosissima]
MLARVEPGKKQGGDSGNGQLLKELEVLSKALCTNKDPPKGKVSATDVRSKSAGRVHVPESKSKPAFVKEDSSEKDKKSSIWGWKPWKALSHIRSRRFNCSFTLHVHAVEGLPSSLNDTSLCVHWKRRDGALQTRPARVFQGVAEFEETLTYRCSVYGSGSGPQHSAKYEARHFLLYASIVGYPDFDLGKHRLDLTRILPLTLEELEEEKSSGKWTTSFKLSGKAKGAIMNASFGYLVNGDDQVASGSYRSHPGNQKLKQNSPGSMKLSTANRVDNMGTGVLRRSGSLRGNPNQRSILPPRSVEDVKILHEILPTATSELASSVSILYKKFDEDNLDSLVDSKPNSEASSEHVDPLYPKPDSLFRPPKESSENECEDTEFTVVEKGVEMHEQCSLPLDEGPRKSVSVSAVNTTVVPEIDENNEVDFKMDIKTHVQDESYNSNQEVDIFESTENNTCSKESVMEELDSAFRNLSISEQPAGLDSSQCKSEFPEQENHMEVKSSYKTSRMGKSLSLDDVTESVASEFLNMLGIEDSPFGLSSDSDPESPRERLLKQFEMDTLNCGNCIFNFDTSKGKEAELSYDAPSGSSWVDLLSEDFELSSAIQAAEAEHRIAIQAINSKTRAKMLEDMETEALMREWGLNENVFQRAQSDSASGFGSPIDLPPEGPLELPPLGEGLGQYLQTKDGGFLRSMNPLLFRNAKNCGSLIMQVSTPIVVPAEMGSGIMEILQCLASVGIEKLSMQAKKLMPLEDITGKTMHQVAWEATPSLEAGERQAFLQHELEIEQDRFGGRKKGDDGAPSGHKFDNLGSGALSTERGSEYVSLEDLAPLAMDKIEALSVEGLRVQCGMSDEDAPSNISPQSIGEISALEGKRANISGSLGLEGAAGLQLLDVKDGGDDVDGLMSLSITLDEWMRLDSGIVDEDQISERTSKILAAHHANSMDLVTGGWKGDKKQGKGSGKRYGLLGNNFTVALMVQLRDPLRNYEPVGTPMLALVQVERIFVPPKPKIYSTVSERRIKSDEDEESEQMVKEENKDELKDKKDEEEGIPQFKITEVHVAGIKNDPNKKKLWGTKTQQQTGSRWLLASGMGKSNKHPFLKSKAITKSSPEVTTTVQPGDTLWSISARVHGNGAKWKELAALNPHIRNPNIILPNETIRLR